MIGRKGTINTNLSIPHHLSNRIMTLALERALRCLFTTALTLAVFLPTAAVAHAVIGTDAWFKLAATVTLAITTFTWHTWSRATPTPESLADDLKQLDAVLPSSSFQRPVFDVRRYFALTTFRDYQWFARAVGCPTLHTELTFPSRTAPSFGYLQQLAYILTYLPPRRRRILEVGPGKGLNACALAALLPDTQVDGLDLVEEHVAFANASAQGQKLPNAAFRLGDAAESFGGGDDHNHENAAYDLIFGVESLCYMDTDAKRERFLANAHRALTPGGRLVIVDAFRTPQAVFQAASTCAQRAMEHAEAGSRILAMPSKETWKTAATAAAFTVMSDADLTPQALHFWTLGHRLAKTVLALATLPLLRAYFQSSRARTETACNFAIALTFIHALTQGTAEYGVLVLEKKEASPVQEIIEMEENTVAVNI